MAASSASDKPAPGSRGKVVLAYSGGLDTSVIVRWLVEDGYDVICYCADVGQKDSFSGIEKKARNAGASGYYLDNLHEEFVEDFVFPAVAWNAQYENRYLLGTSLARPVIAKRMVEIAKKEGAQFIAHGATGKGNDQIRFELTAYALMPEVQIIAPWRDRSSTRSSRVAKKPSTMPSATAFRFLYPRASHGPRTRTCCTFRMRQANSKIPTVVHATRCTS